MKILITGGKGFIGSKIVEILSQDHSITIVDNHDTYGLLDKQELQKLFEWRQMNWNKENVSFVYGDILDRGTCLKAFSYHPDIVIHLATYPRAKIVDNEWAISMPNQLISGKQKLIADLVNKNGKVIAKDYISLHGNVIRVAKDKTILVVQKGDALWKIAYQRLGGGQKYFDIINLNKEKINNPDLIYPKQLFILP